MQIIILIVIGLISAMIGALVGLGGGVFIVPLLIFFGETFDWMDAISPQVAVGTSSAVLIFIGLSAVLGYRKSNQVDMKNGKLFLIGIIPGALFGSYINRFFTLDGFYLYFGMFLIFISILLIYRNKMKPLKLFQQEKHMQSYTDREGSVLTYSVPPGIAVVSSFVVGFFTGLFGIGGGALMTPIMLLLFRMPPGVVVGTSMLLVFIGGLSSATGHFIQGNINAWYALFLIPAAFIGAKFGVTINQRISSERVVMFLRITLMFIGVYMILQTLV